MFRKENALFVLKGDICKRLRNFLFPPEHQGQSKFSSVVRWGGRPCLAQPRPVSMAVVAEG